MDELSPHLGNFLVLILAVVAVTDDGEGRSINDLGLHEFFLSYLSVQQSCSSTGPFHRDLDFNDLAVALVVGSSLLVAQIQLAGWAGRMEAVHVHPGIQSRVGLLQAFRRPGMIKTRHLFHRREQVQAEARSAGNQAALQRLGGHNHAHLNRNIALSIHKPIEQGQPRTRRAQVDLVQASPQALGHPANMLRHALRRRRDFTQRGNRQLLDAFDQHLFTPQLTLLLNLAQAHSHHLQPVLFGRQAGFQFGLPTPQHPLHLLNRQVFVKQIADLVQRETQILQRQNTVQPGELIQAVISIAGETIGPGRFKEPHLGVKPQGFDGDVRQPGEVANLQHRSFLSEQSVFCFCKMWGNAHILQKE